MAMQNDVQITITTFQRDIDPEPMVETHRGSFARRGDSFFLKYITEDSPVIKSAVKFTALTVEVTRSVYRGSMEGCSHADLMTSDAPGFVQLTRMYFERGRRTRMPYATAAGELEIEVFTKDIRIASDGPGTVMDLSYDMDINGQFVSACELRMEIRNDC